LVISFGQTLIHYKVAHHPIGGKLFRNHINFHHTHYADDHLVSRTYLGDEGNITPYFFIPVFLVGGCAYFLLPLNLFVVIVIASAASFYAYVFFDKEYHIEGSWLQRFAWFRHQQKLHFVHHHHANSNFGVIHFFWDRILGTYRKPAAGFTHTNRGFRIGVERAARSATVIGDWDSSFGRFSITSRRPGSARVNDWLMHCIAWSALDYRSEVAMLPDQRTPDDDVCPVGDDLFAELYRASKLGLPALVATVSPDIRAMLALFCYHRSHLYEMGLAIAASCDEDDLVESGGRVGAALFARSREAPNAEPVASYYTARRKITLATGFFREMPGMDMDREPDEEVGEAVPVVYSS